jgi:hypothetical protein
MRGIGIPKGIDNLFQKNPPFFIFYFFFLLKKLKNFIKYVGGQHPE